MNKNRQMSLMSLRSVESVYHSLSWYLHLSGLQVPPDFFETPHLWWICSSIAAARSGCSRLIGLLPELFRNVSPDLTGNNRPYRHGFERNGEMMVQDTKLEKKKKHCWSHHKILFNFDIYYNSTNLPNSVLKTTLLLQDFPLSPMTSMGFRIHRSAHDFCETPRGSKPCSIGRLVQPANRKIIDFIKR